MINNKKFLPILISSIMILTLIMIYAAGIYYFKDHYFPKTSINNKDVSLYNLDEANTIISLDKPIIEIIQKGKDGKEIKETISLISPNNDLLRYDTKDLLNQQNVFLWPLNIFNIKEYQTNKISGSYNEDFLRQDINNLYCMQEENRIAPTDAHIEIKDKELIIIEANDGNMIDKQLVIDEIINKTNNYLKDNKTNIINLISYYEKPSFSNNNNELLPKLNNLKDILNKKITININDQTNEILEGDELLNLLKIENNNFEIIDDNLKEYVNKIVKKYNISSKEYIDSINLTNNLINNLLRNNDITINASWINISSSANKVVVSISNQKLYYYENGELIITSDIVSGYGDWPTPKGNFIVHFMGKDRTLRIDGGEYPVSYWIGFDEGTGGHLYGLHDASWRNGQFGGDIYLTNSSHGCINMPTEKIAQLYPKMEIGTEIIIEN